MLKTKVSKKIDTNYTLELDREKVLKLLQNEFPQILDRASIYMQVPGGADWSNCELEIERDTMLYVEWDETSHEVEED